MTSRIPVNYVTKNVYKRQENEILVASGQLTDGTAIRELFDFRIREIDIKEILDVDLKAMVVAEAAKAYGEVKVPCIVEHAGLIFGEYERQAYPGGLTKPMWNALGDRFVIETHSGGRRATARAVVAYCDGLSIQTFVGETEGRIADTPRGSRHQFYWDTIFMPDIEGKEGRRTYAEIVQDPHLGWSHKVISLSQSTKAMIKFLDYRRNATPSLWPDW